MNLNYELKGTGEIVIVVATALGSTYAEWRPILEPLSQTCKILLYDRAGYGKSPVSAKEKSPKQIAQELNELINTVAPQKKYLLIGHSYGGLIMQQFARDFPADVIGAIFIDPATTEENRFRQELTNTQYKKSGIDKMRSIKQGVLFGKLRLLKIFKPLLRKSIPFYYYKNYDNVTENDILKHLTQLTTYSAMFEEYSMYQNQEKIKNELLERSFPTIPVHLVTHNPKIMIEEIVHFGGLSEAEAEKIDLLWQEIMENDYSKLSDNYTLKVAEKSGHYIHLTDSETVIKSVKDIILDFIPPQYLS